ncbi:hypothetical protein GCM10012290_00370 [Halolactibacillus alkaliphilus]|uniref:Transcriptional regulator LacI/GalR-like sensor domain-containing protein n=1 Tax=Halolactibacillus alkaliphilus TaxID=442899 RepID=A0A511WYM7_9BACI|nr:substrate-binding domain-containing protein [Halolactibacillus alkaliphilus]GEN55638.1 hypothetical protein HAL01_01020 [Halolactibacillus alkaliphilus]GGN63640.1 hypothetical protein GCM10012290_00370 [Halolactibacillus alkaliphilus]
MNALRKHNLTVPQDDSIISIDDLYVPQFLTPALTTVKVFTEAIGEIDVNTLKERIEADHIISKRIVLSTELIIRDTVRNSLEK